MDLICLKTRLNRINEDYKRQIQNFANSVLREVIIPFCRTHNIIFAKSPSALFCFADGMRFNNSQAIEPLLNCLEWTVNGEHNTIKDYIAPWAPPEVLLNKKVELFYQHSGMKRILRVTVLSFQDEENFVGQILEEVFASKEPTFQIGDELIFNINNIISIDLEI